MRTSRRGITARACIFLAFGLLILPLRWMLAAAAAAAFHELCHYLAVRMCGGRVFSMRVGGSGALMESEGLSKGQVLFCTLAGPVGGIMLLLFAKWIPAVAVCAAFQSAYNLLPLENLDGGAALRSLLSLLLPPHIANRISMFIHRLCLFSLTVGAVYAAVWMKLGWIPLILALALIVKSNSGT